MAENEAGRRTPWYFWAFGVFALLWNCFGVFLWGGTTFQPETFLKDELAVRREYVMGLPMWSSLTWGLGVLGGAIGSLLLLLRNRLAVPAFAVSLFGAVVNQLVYVTNPPPPGFFNPGLTIFIIAFAAISLWFAQWAKKRGIL